MKRILMIICTLAALAFRGLAYGGPPPPNIDLEPLLTISNEGVRPALTLYTTSQHGNIMAQCFGTVTAGRFAEAICGAGARLSPGIQAGLMGGISTLENPWTVGGLLLASWDDKPFLFIFAQWSAAGEGHLIKIGRPLGPIHPQIMSARGSGEGLRISVPTPKITPFGSALFNTEAYLTEDISTRDALCFQLGLQFNL